jgi:hypothetical protein
MDLAKFLIQRHEREQQEQGKLEAQAQGAWRGGNEENFVKMVKELSEGKMADEIQKTNNEPDVNKGESKNDENGVPPLDMPKEANKELVVNEGEPKKGGPPKEWEYLQNIMSWQALQHVLLDNNLLPKPIAQTKTARGHSGLPSNETPSLEGARRGTIACATTHPEVQEVMSSMLAFWNDPRGERNDNPQHTNTKLYNATHPHPFLPAPLPPFDDTTPKSSRIRHKRYLTFEPDTGGWNNLRMSFENIIVLAAMSGRTLVLPPDQIIYLLEPRKGDTRRGRNYNDIFNLTDNNELLRRVPIITAEEFLAIEGGNDGLIPIDKYNSTYQKHLLDITKECEERKKSDVFCEDLYDHYRDHGLLADISAEPPHEQCFIFDIDVFNHGEEFITKLSSDIQRRVKKFCGVRPAVYYSKAMHGAPLWHFETMDLRYRMLVHYYAQIFFTDPEIGNYYKRLVRDYLRYHDEVFCAAGKIMLALQYESYERDLVAGVKRSTLDLDSELVGGYSALHIRRGDLQFKEVKFSAKEWYENTKELWKRDEVLYIATDENFKPWFDDFRQSHSGQLRFFSDYHELADLDSIDPTLYGMIDTLIASRGTIFAGTWFSTFSGYIVRLRGYYGMSKFSTYYSYLERKYFMHSWMNVGEGSLYAREYPTGWTGIDGDAFVDNDREGDVDPFKGRAGEAFAVEQGIVKVDVKQANDQRSPLQSKSVARGVSGLPLSSTPAVVGAERGHITCDVEVDRLAYWNEPQGTRDYTFTSPFRDKTPNAKTKYLAFMREY